jgi:hypothetical protein
MIQSDTGTIDSVNQECPSELEIGAAVLLHRLLSILRGLDTAATWPDEREVDHFLRTTSWRLIR